MFLIGFFLLAAAPCGEFPALLLSHNPLARVHVTEIMIEGDSVLMC